MLRRGGGGNPKPVGWVVFWFGVVGGWGVVVMCAPLHPLPKEKKGGWGAKINQRVQTLNQEGGGEIKKKQNSSGPKSKPNRKKKEKQEKKPTVDKKEKKNNTAALGWGGGRQKKNPTPGGWVFGRPQKLKRGGGYGHKVPTPTKPKPEKKRKKTPQPQNGVGFGGCFWWFLHQKSPHKVK